MTELWNHAETRARWRFALVFALIAALLLTLYTFPYQESGIRETWFRDYLAAYARLAGAALSPFEPHVAVSGHDIVGRYSLRIVKSCDAMEEILLLGAAVLAFPSNWRRRVAGIAVGTASLVALNVLRIATLYYVGVYAPGAFEFFHVELWPLVLVVSSVMVFVVWASWANESGLAETSHAAPQKSPNSARQPQANPLPSTRTLRLPVGGDPLRPRTEANSPALLGWHRFRARRSRAQGTCLAKGAKS